ncbi:MAG: DNA-directed RNA polymerase [Candidatus Aenigmarchaeota archaeon]|nr:DNA-directed RNA polymerase [Candidatus Aenigmarchaeota archaeon]
MYKLLTVEDVVRVPPAKLGMPIKKAVKQSLQEQMEGVMDKETGVIVAITNVESVGEGRLLPGDGSIHYVATFDVLVYYPTMYEVVGGEVIDITEFGAFVRMGPLDGLVHISQVMDDFVSYDSKNSIFLGKDSKRTVKEGDSVKARVITVSIGKNDYKIGMTMRQNGLGVLEWAAAKKAETKDQTPVTGENKG